MKYVIIVALLLAQITHAFAQTSGDNDEDAPGIRTIKLESSIVLHQFAMPVKNIEVIAIADDSTNLGISRNKYREVTSISVPDKPLQEYLQAYISKKYGDQYQQNNGKYLLCLVQLFRINDLRSSPERSYVRIKGVTFLSPDNQQFQLSAQFDTTLIDADKRASRDHKWNMARAIDLFLTAADKPSVTGTPHSREEIMKIAWERYQQPIYTTTRYTDGVYMSYKEFLRNAPSVNNFIIRMEQNKANVYHIHNDSSRNIIPEPWGICYNGQLFRCKWNTFIPLKRHGLTFDIADRDTTVYLKVTGGQYLDQAVGFGLLGVLALRAKEETDGREAYFVTYLQDLLDRPYARMIDPFTGELMF